MQIIFGTTHNAQTKQNMTTNCYMELKKSVISKLNGKNILFISEGMNTGIITKENKHYDIYVFCLHQNLLKFCRRNNVHLLFTDSRPYAQSFEQIPELYNEFIRKTSTVMKSTEIKNKIPRSIFELQKMIDDDCIDWRFKENTPPDVLESKKHVLEWFSDSDQVFLEEMKKTATMIILFYWLVVLIFLI